MGDAPEAEQYKRDMGNITQVRARSKQVYSQENLFSYN
jgi:hypothetical protein